MSKKEKKTVIPEDKEEALNSRMEESGESGKEPAGEETPDGQEALRHPEEDMAEEASGEEQEDSAPEAEKEAAGEEAETEISGKKDPRDLKIEELNDKHMRLMAEFENFRKRSEKEKESMFETGAKSVIEKILPVVDNFERALGMAGDLPEEEEENADPFMKGMRLVYKQMMTALDGMGVRPIEALGKEFDPAFHNAVMQEESEEAESGTILKELQKGYLYRNSVVRHSMVSVAQ